MPRRGKDWIQLDQHRMWDTRSVFSVNYFDWQQVWFLVSRLVVLRDVPSGNYSHRSLWLCRFLRVSPSLSRLVRARSSFDRRMEHEWAKDPSIRGPNERATLDRPFRYPQCSCTLSRWWRCLRDWAIEYAGLRQSTYLSRTFQRHLNADNPSTTLHEWIEPGLCRRVPNCSRYTISFRHRSRCEE